MTPILAAYVLTGSTVCNNPVFTAVASGCSSGGTLILSSTTLAPYMVGGSQASTMQDRYVYVQLQGSSSVPSGNYTLSVQGTVTGHTLTNATTTSIRVNFPSFSNPTPGKYVVYWQKVGTTGANYVNLTPASNYTINGLNSNQSYRVWVKYVDVATTGGSQIYAAAVTGNTTAGCGGNLSAPSVVQTVGHCSQAEVSWTSVTSQGVPTNLVPAASTYPYRVIYSYTNGTGFHGFIQALASLPPSGYHASNLPLSSTINFYYSFKCVGGALMTSYSQAYTTCAGQPEQAAQAIQNM
jgi:Fibronectin type III domain